MSSKNPVAVSDNLEKLDWRSEFVAWVGSKLLTLGVVATLLATAALCYYANHFSNAVINDARQIEVAQHTIDTLRVTLIAALLVFGAGMTISFWGDFALPLILFLVAVVYYFAPDLLREAGLVSDSMWPKMAYVSMLAQGALNLGGMVLGCAAILLQIVDVSVRVRHRAKYGSKGDQIKYGENVKEEADYQNIFMGKCWQLPFCRKFVRQECPIYHSRRTCWKERVGCMCEEEVIRGAMEGKPIPRDAVAAARYIPHNNRYSPAQKAERCRQCVIYNEHQRHKYKLAMISAPFATFFVYVLFREPLLLWANAMLRDFDRAMEKFAFTTSNAGVQKVVTSQPGYMEEVFIVLVLLFALSQVMRLVEYSIFKLKI
jgi:hypothetical protein